jgi:N-acyl-D-aspartate/D-glutamate deacylase
MPQFDIVIKDGMIIDGARMPRFRGDIAIKDGAIARIGRVNPSQARREIDARGLVVAPGFIDLHTHYDAQVFWDPYLTTSGWHGVTSVVTGNCGFGFAPTREELRERAMLSMTRVEAIPLATMKSALPWDWVTYPEFLDSIDRVAKAVNVLPYVPVNPLLIWVLGLEAAKAGRKPTDAEHAEMARVLNEAMDAGACGWSAQSLGQPGKPARDSAGGPQGDFDGTSMPSDVMWPEIRMVLAKVLGERGAGFIELSTGLAGREHWEELAAVSGAPMLWQAVPASAGEAGEKFRRDLFSWFKSCHERGLRIYGQGLLNDCPLLFTFEYWDLWGPVWDELVGPDVPTDRKLANLADPAARSRLREAPRTFMFVDTLNDTILLATSCAEYKKYERHRIGEIVRDTGKSPVDIICDIAGADKLKTIFQTSHFHIGTDGLRHLVDNPYIIPGLSDGGAHTKYLTAGGYATEFIASLVREREFTSLEDAHWRLSALPASCAGFRNRGMLQEGAAADIIVYDYERLGYTFPEFVRDLPGDEYRVVSRGRGYRHVLVNGEQTIEDDQQTNRYSGRLLRGGKA